MEQMTSCQGSVETLKTGEIPCLSSLHFGVEFLSSDSFQIVHGSPHFTNKLIV